MQDAYLRWPRVHAITGLSRTTVWRAEKAGLFPQRRQIGVKSVAWLQSDIQQWVASRQQVRGHDEKAS